MHLKHDLQRLSILLGIVLLPSTVLASVATPLAYLYTVLCVLTLGHQRYMLKHLAPIEPAGQSLALVTGGTSGIGAKISEGLARRGFGLVLVSRSAATLAARVVEVKAAHPSLEVRSFVQDLGVPGAAKSLYDQLEAAGDVLPRCAVLVNSAGCCIPPKLLAETPLDVLENMLTLNMCTLASLTRLVLPHMLEAKRGRVLNVSSVVGEAPAGLAAAYHATKSFVSSFSLGLQYELEGTGVGVTAVAPGATDTDFAKVGGATRSLVFSHPLTHRGPKAIAAAALSGMFAGESMVSPPLADWTSRFYTDIVVPHFPSRATLFIATLFWRDPAELPYVEPLFFPRRRGGAKGEALLEEEGSGNGARSRKGSAGAKGEERRGHALSVELSVIAGESDEEDARPPQPGQGAVALFESLYLE